MALPVAPFWLRVISLRAHHIMNLLRSRWLSDYGVVHEVAASITCSHSGSLSRGNEKQNKKPAPVQVKGTQVV